MLVQFFHNGPCTNKPTIDWGHVFIKLWVPVLYSAKLEPPTLPEPSFKKGKGERRNKPLGSNKTGIHLDSLFNYSVKIVNNTMRYKISIPLE